MHVNFYFTLHGKSNKDRRYFIMVVDYAGGNGLFA
jgi:hypothetical protein